jgi:putative DNA methylase
MKSPMEKLRIYERRDVISFRSTDGPFGGLSNMAPGFPVIIGGLKIRTVEALYQALRYPHLPGTQKMIIEQHSPMTAKMVGRRYLDQTRADWDEIKVGLMRWCLRLKLAQNWELFSAVLLSTHDRTIVEDSRKDPFWGAVPREGEKLEGKNVLGRLLMELRAELVSDAVSLRAFPKPQFPGARLFGQEIAADSVAVTDSTLEGFTPMAASRPSEPSRMSTTHPKRLIEVDLPIKRISAHARREKSIRHGHISTLHIWWARRPLAACRAVICASLWPDPVDPNCPPAFFKAAKKEMLAWTDHEHLVLLSEDSRPRFEKARRKASHFDDPLELRHALLDFIADFANWDSSTVKEYLETSRALTQAAHEALGGAPGTRPLVVDPFAGGGSIPLEALRVGADAFASDLNPIPILLNKVTLEYIPKYGQRLADEVRKWGSTIKQAAEAELGKYYPNDANGATPIAYLWARTVLSEAPDDGSGMPVEIPLLRSFWLSKKAARPLALRWARKKDGVVLTDAVEIAYSNGKTLKVRRPRLELFTPKAASEVPSGTVTRGSASCPVTGHTTPVKSVREQLKLRKGGTNDARLYCVVTTRIQESGRFYRLPNEQDVSVVKAAETELKKRVSNHVGKFSLIPNEETPMGGGSGAGRAFSQRNYGMNLFGELYTSRQLLALTTLARLVEKGQAAPSDDDEGITEAVKAVLGIAVSRLADRMSSLCTWRPQADQEKVEHVFTRQALPMTWDFAEGIFLSERTAGWNDAYEPPAQLIEEVATGRFHAGQVEAASATEHPLPSDSVSAFITDPPYYDAVPYADLSDYFVVWLKRTVPKLPTVEGLSPKNAECIVDEVKGKDHTFYEKTMALAMAEGRRVLTPSGIGLVVFAHKSTSGWEAQLQAMIDAGWIVTGSWPIDTEMGTRLRAQGSAALASSIHIVVRPREHNDRSAHTKEVGDWRDILDELPKRIHDWMPRLASEGVVGADAIFACLGPALEIFSRHSRVEKASGEQITLREYLEHVWAAVSKEALSSLIAGTDLSALEADARITAMWLWTLGAGAVGEQVGIEGLEQAEEDEEEGGKKAPAKGGYSLEYDAARKISQGLGASLEDLKSIIEVKGDQARLLPVNDRTAYLFGKEQASAPGTAVRAKKKVNQLDLFAELTGEPAAAEAVWEEKTVSKPGATVLDRVHQAMILFATGRGDALKRFLVENGVGQDANFWRLAQALSALYPPASQEKRWVDGVLARKKGLGL